MNEEVIYIKYEEDNNKVENINIENDEEKSFKMKQMI